MMKIEKLPARAMLYAILISLLVAIIAGALVSLSFSQRMLQERAFLQERLIRNAASGIQLLLSLEEPPINPIDLFDNQRDSLKLEKIPWGLFELGRSTAFHGQDSFIKVVFLGWVPQTEQRAALYLADGNSPLAVCGSTEIIGDAYLPRAGVKRGHIPNANYQGTKMVYGEIKISKINLPAFNEKKLTALKNMPTDLLANTSLEGDTIVGSFAEAPKIIKGGLLRVDNIVLKGHLILIAEQAISFGANAVVEDILVFAPQIIFEEGFVGQLQAVAGDSLYVAPNCRFLYPTTLGVLRSSDNQTAAYLHIDSLAEVKGLVWLKDLAGGRQKAQARIASSTFIEGEVYVDGFLDFQGVVYGRVACRKFSLRTAASVYENHLLNCKIDIHKRHKAFLLPDFWAIERPKKAIVKLL